MSYPGGTADKLGGRYESRWTLHSFLGILRGEADSIKIEPLGPLGDGIEFELKAQGRTEYHQVKRQLTGKGQWALGALKTAGVIETFKAVLERGDHPRFVSGHDAHKLHELSDRARHSTDIDDFRKQGAGGDTWLEDFGTLRQWWGWDEAVTYDALRRCDVKVIGDDELHEWNRALVEPLLDEKPDVALAVLAQVAIDNLQQEIDGETLWRLLEGPPYDMRRRQWDVTGGVVAEQVHSDLETYAAPMRAIRLQHVLRRPEAEQSLRQLENPDTRAVLLSGSAGAGKSDVVLQTMDLARAEGFEVLALRVDRLDPAASPEAIGEQLGLPGSPASVLAAVAGARPSLLVIDQLDALSLASGRKTELWDAIYALIVQARAQPGMRVLLACRQFDIDNDHRLRALASEDDVHLVVVPPLTDDQIDESVTALGVDPAALTPRQRRLLGLPLHLSLLEQLPKREESLEPLRSAKDLFDAFWDHKRRVLRERAGGPVRLAETVSAVAQQMSERRALSVPEPVLDAAGLGDEIDLLASEYILIRAGGRIAFFHEAFFDYAFARFYLATGQSISDLLKDDEQDLFRRAQLRALLTAQRDMDRGAYLVAVRELLQSDTVRFHLKQVVVALLLDVVDSGRDELELLEPYLFLRGDPLEPLVWRAMSRPEWFDLADAAGLPEGWLASTDPRLVDRGIRILADAFPHRPSRAMELLNGARDPSEEWQVRLLWVVRFVDLAVHRGLVDIFVQLIDEGALDDNLPDAFIYLQALSETEPTWAAEIITHIFERALLSGSDQHPLEYGGSLHDDYAAQEAVAALATAAPSELVDAVLPFVLATVSSTLESPHPEDMPRERPLSDRIFGFRVFGGDNGLPGALIAALEVALARVARDDADHFSELFSVLADHESDTAQFLLYRGLLGNPQEFADRAGELLLESEARLRSGYSTDPWWATRELLQAIAPHLTTPIYERLEERLLHYAPAYERRPASRSFRGYAEFRLLGGLANGRGSDKADRRIGELARKFQVSEPESPSSGVVAGFVGPPIPEEAVSKMSDDDWLRAIGKHTKSWEEKRTADLIGGADQQANVLRREAETDPERFARLGLLLGPDTVPTYIESLVIGLGQPATDATPADPETIWAFARHVSGLPDNPAERWLPWMIARTTEHDVPDDILEIVQRLATEAADPTPEQWVVGNSEHDRIWDIGMNSVRGAAVEACGQLLWARDERLDVLGPAIEAASGDPVPPVRASAAMALQGLARWDRDRAVRLLIESLDIEDALLTARPVQGFLRLTIRTHWGAIEPVVEQMLRSPFESARAYGGSLACMASLDVPEARDVADRAATHSDPAIRAGAARVFAANLGTTSEVERCEAMLTRLFGDSESAVREAAVRVFWELDPEAVADHADLAHALIESPAYAEGRSNLLRALLGATGLIAEVALNLCEHMIQDDLTGMTDLSTRLAADARDVAQLLVRVLAQATDEPGVRSRALDGIDAMLAAGAYGVDTAVALADR